MDFAHFAPFGPNLAPSNLSCNDVKAVMHQWIHIILKNIFFMDVIACYDARNNASQGKETT